MVSPSPGPTEIREFVECISLCERLEDRLQLFRGNSNSSVGHGEVKQQFLLCRCVNLNAQAYFSLRSKLHCVLDRG